MQQWLQIPKVLLQGKPVVLDRGQVWGIGGKFQHSIATITKPVCNFMELVDWRVVLLERISWSHE